MCVLCMTIHAQPRFLDQTAAYQIVHTYGNGISGGGVSLCDFNGDGKDDISLGSSRGKVIQFYENKGATFHRLDLLTNLKEEIKSLLWADLDNDGDKDLFVCIFEGHNRIYENKGNLDLEDITAQSGISLEDYSSFGACIGDYNRDGLLDIYVSQRRVQTDGLPNRSLLYRNDGNLIFTDVTLNAGAEDGGKTPFCSAFVDVNNDKWPDLYTAHDRERGNSLLINNKNGTFSSEGSNFNADLKMDGMSVSTADVNFDGYMDIYVSNSTDGNALFVNKNGMRFENESTERGVSFNGVAWGTNFLDGDNDGDDDLYVSSMLVGKENITSTYFTNEYPSNLFSKGDQVLSDTVSSFNNAVGDLNSDGYPDIVVSNSEFSTTVFENQGGEHHFLAINLQGVLSNRDGIGSLVTVYTQEKKISKYTQCGIGFLGQNSNQLLFGLDNVNAADSIEVLWPSGHIDRYLFVAGNTSYVLVEGGSTDGKINVDEGLILSNFEQKTETRLKLSPNPVTTYCTLDIPASQIREIHIIDITGKEVIKKRNPNQNEINVESLPAGSYWLQCILQTGVVYGTSIIIQK
ncbi:MAG: VCBS repeat-containing protein [Saprospiraceae bacterium]|nr:VCBS repeat-containing protein [Saprospiraceae bacterium]